MSDTTRSNITPARPPQVIPDNLKGKRVVLVNHGDMLGGAAIVTFRLMKALRARGIDARMVVFTKSSDDSDVSKLASRYERGLRFVAERLKMFLLHSVPYAKIFQVSTGDFALDVTRHEWVRDADIVCLNWINQGLLGLDGIRRLHRKGKKIVWTLHDQWAFTGICHHPYECDHFRDKCGSCMFVRGGGDPDDISRRMWERKKKLYEEVPVHFVTVSNWLEQRARSSSLLKTMPVMTIHNVFPIDTFYTTPPLRVEALATGSKPNVILFGAARLDDPIKGLDMLIEACNIIFDNHPDIAGKTAIILFGGMKNPEILDTLRMSHRWLGMINDFKILRYLYSTAKAVVSTSFYESLAGTLIEGQAAGALSVTFGGDGREDIVTHLKNGYIAEYRNPADIANGILWALNADISRDELHQGIADRFGPDIITQKYIDLFSDILKDNSHNA